MLTNSQSPKPSNNTPVPNFTGIRCRCNVPPNCIVVVPQYTNPITTSSGVINIRLYKIMYAKAFTRIPSTPITNVIVGKYTCPVHTSSRAEISVSYDFDIRPMKTVLFCVSTF